MGGVAARGFWRDALAGGNGRFSRAATLSATCCLMACLLLPAPAGGQGFRNLDNGATAAAQGAAVAAQADDPSAVQYNPAGLTQLPGFQVSVGTNLMSARVTFTAVDGARVRGGNPGLLVHPPPSNLYLTAQLGGSRRRGLRSVTAGLGVSAPFGLQVSYPADGALSTVSTYATLPLLNVKPTLAVKLNDDISVGGGIDIYAFTSLIGGGEARLKLIAGPEFAPLGIPAGTSLEANGHDSAVGFNVGGLITPLRYASGKPRINLGVVYRSPVTLNLKGNFLTNGVRAAGAELPVRLPQIVTSALAIWPVRNDQREYKLEVDVDYVDWSSFLNSNLTLSSGGILPFPRDWRTAYVFMLGTEYRWLRLHGRPGWEVVARPGYIHSSTPVPERTFDPVIPDAPYNAFSFGVGLLCRDRGSFVGVLPCGNGRGARLAPKTISLDLAYQAVLHNSRRITDNIDPRVKGQWEGLIHVVAINLGIRL